MCNYEFNKDFNYMKCPCKGCMKRHFNCHSLCREYKDFKNRMEEFKEKKRREEERYSVSVSKTKTMRKNQRKNSHRNSMKWT